MGPSRKSRTVATDRRFSPTRAFITCVKLAVLAVFVGLAVCASTAADTPRNAAPQPAGPNRHATPVRPAATSCTTPAPTTAAGYTAMFAAVPTTLWGAADVAISVKVGVRSVWLWGDTISQVTSWPFTGLNGRFVHSTAITQDRGCLHVSNGGGQLLPNDSDGTWYWVKAAAAVDSTHLRITADHVQRTGPGAWDFKVIGDRTATATLASNGDVTFQSWTGTPVPVQHIVQKDGGIYAPWAQTVSEIANGKILVSGLPHTTDHFSYAPSVHPDLPLSGGKMLLTVCQNASPLNSYDWYRPLFYGVVL